MFSRRTFLSLVAGSMATPGLASAQPASQKIALYANVGADLTHYDVDVAGAELIKRATVTLPAAVQYAWPHVSWTCSVDTFTADRAFSPIIQDTRSFDE